MLTLLVIALVTLFLQWVLYLYVMRRDRNHITQSGLLVVGMFPVLGFFVLGEHALFEAGWVTRRAGPPPKPAPDLPVGTVSQRRAALDYDPADLLDDYLTDERLGDMGMDDLDTMDS
jgi:hypothetical protein